MLRQVVGRLVQTGVGRRAAGERILVAQRAAAHRRIEAERVASPSCATDTSSSSSMMAHHRAPVGAQVNVLQHLPKISNKHALVISNNSRRENLGQGRGGFFFFSLSLYNRQQKLGCLHMRGNRGSRWWWWWWRPTPWHWRSNCSILNLWTGASKAVERLSFSSLSTSDGERKACMVAILTRRMIALGLERLFCSLFFLKKKNGQSASVEIPGLAYYTHTLGWTSGPEAIFLGRSFSRIYWRNHQQPQKPVNTIRERKEAFLPFI